jgi:hypothetical protein
MSGARPSARGGSSGDVEAPRPRIGFAAVIVKFLAVRNYALLHNTL